ncbi:MAG: hypothetical protein GX491_07400, partial [Chloroflexi bacterium]|nr:hypothetical protein [Chloroflexota bacterium]
MAKHSPTIKNRPGMGRFAFFSGLRSLTTSNRRPLRSPVQDARMLLALVAILAALLLASCAPSTPAETPAPAVDPTQTFQAALAQAASAIPTQTPLPTATVPPPTLTPTPTAPAVQVCSPLVDHPIAELLLIVSDPYYRPPANNPEGR